MRFVLVVVAAGSCDRSCQCAIAPNTFLREVPPPVLREQLCLVVADADVSVANSSREGHSNQRFVQFTELGSTTASTDETELAQTGGISSCARLLGSNNHYRILVWKVSFFFTLICDLFSLEVYLLAGSVRPSLRLRPGSDTPRTSSALLACAT